MLFLIEKNSVILKSKRKGEKPVTETVQAMFNVLQTTKRDDKQEPVDIRYRPTLSDGQFWKSSLR